jgi:hypothetical protein
MKTKSKPEKLMLRVVKGGFQPADGYTQERLKAKGFKVGDLVASTLSKPRVYWQHKKAHVLGKLVAENLDGFAGMSPHAVLKRLQIESGVGCETIGVIFPGIGPCQYRIPVSLSYDSMDQTEFEEVYSGFCQHVIDKYWPTMTEEQIEIMGELLSTG